VIHIIIISKNNIPSIRLVIHGALSVEKVNVPELDIDYDPCMPLKMMIIFFNFGTPVPSINESYDPRRIKQNVPEHVYKSNRH